MTTTRSYSVKKLLFL